MTRTSYIGSDDVHFVQDQHTYLDFYSTSSLKQQTEDRHVAPLGHIILINDDFNFIKCFQVLVENRWKEMSVLYMFNIHRQEKNLPSDVECAGMLIHY
jgi:hypothetical protein